VDLAQVLGELKPNTDPRVIADYRNASDAGVLVLRDGLALVQTVDFITPIVDDPYVYGAVAAANALSDLYAMGATPITALSIVGFPKKGVPFSVLAEIMRGGQEKLAEAGASLLGGHTVQDPEIKFGFAVTGTTDPDHLITNARTRPGDLLYLTKPIGTGVLATALKRGKLAEDALATLTKNLLSLNSAAAEAMKEVRIESATDVTGFGLLGHAAELARASGVSIEIQTRAVPLLPDALALQERGYVTGAVEANRRYTADILEIHVDVSKAILGLLLDPQTSGGLLVAVPPTKEEAFRKALGVRGAAAARIGSVTLGPAHLRIV